MGHGRFIKKALASGVEKKTILQVKGIGATGSFKLAKVEAKPKKVVKAKKASSKKPKTPTKKKAEKSKAKKPAAKPKKPVAKKSKPSKAPAKKPAPKKKQLCHTLIMVYESFSGLPFLILICYN